MATVTLDRPTDGTSDEAPQYTPGAATGTDGFNPSYVQNADGLYSYNGVSQDPGDVGPEDSSVAAAQSDWFAANPSYASYANGGSATGPNLTAGTTTGTGASGSPTGLPSASDVAADAPLGLQSFGATPTVTPSYAQASGYNATTVNPNNTPQYLQAEEAANAASLAPTFQQQDQTNQDQLAARGISSSGAAAEITNQLQASQGATLAGLNAPAIQQQSGYQQADITNNAAAKTAASQYDAGAQQATSEFNAGEGTAASGANAGYYDQALTGDATTYNNYLSTLEGQGYNTANEQYTAYLNSFGPNSGVTSGYNGAVSGIGNAATGAYDSSEAAEGQAVSGVFGAAGQIAAAGASK